MRSQRRSSERRDDNAAKRSYRCLNARNSCPSRAGIVSGIPRSSPTTRGRFGRAAPVRLVLARVGGLVGDEQLDRRAEDGIRKVAGGREWLELVAEVRPEQMIDDGEDFRARAVIPCQRQNTRRGLSPLAKDAHI